MVDWLRNVLYGGFLLVFVGVMYTSFSKLFSGNTAVSQVQRAEKSLLYPSITLCPGFNNATAVQCPTNSSADRTSLRIEDVLYSFFHTYEEKNKLVESRICPVGLFLYNMMVQKK